MADSESIEALRQRKTQLIKQLAEQEERLQKARDQLVGPEAFKTFKAIGSAAHAFSKDGEDTIETLRLALKNLDAQHEGWKCLGATVKEYRELAKEMFAVKTDDPQLKSACDDALRRFLEITAPIDKV